MSPAGLSPLDTTYNCVGVGTCRKKDGPRFFSRACRVIGSFGAAPTWRVFFFSRSKRLGSGWMSFTAILSGTTTSDSSSRSANKTCQVVRQTGNTGVCLKAFGWCLVKLVGLVCYITHININKICICICIIIIIIIIIIITIITIIITFVSFLSSPFHDGIFDRPNTEHWKSCSWGILSSKILKRLKRMNEIRRHCGCRMTKMKNQEPKFHQLNVHNICVRENKVYSPFAASKYIGHI